MYQSSTTEKDGIETPLLCYKQTSSSVTHKKAQASSYARAHVIRAVVRQIYGVRLEIELPTAVVCSRHQCLTTVRANKRNHRGGKSHEFNGYLLHVSQGQLYVKDQLETLIPRQLVDEMQSVHYSPP